MRALRRLAALLLVVPLLMLPAAPAATLAAPALPDSPSLTAEELADVEDLHRWIEANGEEYLAWLASTETTPARERTPGEPKDEGFTILRTDDRSKPVLIFHGRDNYDMAGYAALRNHYLSAGFTNVQRIGYYGGECNVEHNAAHHGSHASWYGGSGEHSAHTGCNGVSGAQVHDLNTDIAHIAYHVAWYVHDHFGTASITVDMLGHSMGGLMMRYAIAKSGSGGVWPAKLRVEDATTMGTPHGGLGTSWCKWSPWSDVRQMCSDSSVMTWLKANAQDPQGNGGTDWTLMGSDCDGWVAWNLAVDMSAAHKVVYVSPCYGHSDYYGDVSTLNDADVDYMDRPATSWSAWGSAPHAARWTNLAATYGTW